MQWQLSSYDAAALSREKYISLTALDLFAF